MGNFPDFPHRPSAISDANALILSYIRPLGDSKQRTETPVSAGAPFFALQFPKTAIAAIGLYGEDRLINRLQTPRRPKPALRVLADHIKFDPLLASAAVPAQFGEWRALISRCDLADSPPLHDWVPILTSLAAHLIRTPAKSAALRWNGISDLPRSFLDGWPVLQMRNALAIGPPASCCAPSIVGSLIAPSQMASTFRGNILGNDAVSRPRAAAVAALGLSTDAEALGPDAKARKIGDAPHCSDVFLFFLGTGA